MTVFLLIFFLLLAAYGFLVDYYRRSWNKMPESDVSKPASLRVSVVVAVRNEEKNMERLLDMLCSQDYPAGLFEIIVVNDHSTDRTTERFEQHDFKGVTKTLLHLDAGQASKKDALARGVHAAVGELIVTTDADCMVSSSWIFALASFAASTGAKFIAAPVRMTAGNTLLGIFQSLDFIALQGITGASVFRRFHTMCNGANLAYRKTAFEEVNGFAGIDNIPSGDDMLLMHKISLKYPRQVFFLKNALAVVTTPSEPRWKDFFHQRIRWASKAVHYKDKNIFYALLLVYLVNVCFLVLAVASVLHPGWLMFLLLLLLAKILIEFPFVHSAAIFFGQSFLMVYFPFLQPLHILYTVVAGWLGRFGSYKWKSRIIKNIRSS